MPQLSPLNWIFLFFLAWGSIFLMFMMLWWNNKMEYFAGANIKNSNKSDAQKSSFWRW